MDRLRRSLRDSFRRKKDHIPECSKPHQWQADEAAVRAGTCSFPVKVLKKNCCCFIFFQLKFSVILFYCSFSHGYIYNCINCSTCIEVQCIDLALSPLQ